MKGDKFILKGEYSLYLDSVIGQVNPGLLRLLLLKELV